ncbi:hypothetical protein D3C84_1018510 [compost metagenome]
MALMFSSMTVFVSAISSFRLVPICRRTVLLMSATSTKFVLVDVGRAVDSGKLIANSLQFGGTVNTPPLKGLVDDTKVPSLKKPMRTVSDG